MNETCKLHAMPALYLCMHCPQTEILCALCVKDSHAKCPDSHIIQPADLKRIVLKSPEINIFGELAPLAKQSAEQNSAKVTREFNMLKLRVNESLNFVEYIDEDFYSLERIQGLKSQYTISYDKQKEKLCFEPRVYTENLATDKVSRALKSSLKHEVESLISKMEAINLNIFHQVLDARRFKHHYSLELIKVDSEQYTESVRITQKDDFGETAFAYLMTPLKNAFFMVSLDPTNEGEKKADLQQVQVGICRLSDNVNWESIKLTKEQSDSSKVDLKNHKFSVSYLKNQKLTVFTDDGRQKSEFKLKNTGDYYFYVSLKNSALSITISE